MTLGMIFFGLWMIFLFTLQRGAQPVQNPILIFPLPVFLLAWFALLISRGENSIPSG